LPYTVKPHKESRTSSKFKPRSTSRSIDEFHTLIDRMVTSLATISVNRDMHVGELISQAMEKVGKVYFVTEHLVVEEEDFIVAGHSFFVRASLIASLCLRH
jgi:chaperonin GroEL (HSP60 family)